MENTTQSSCVPPGFRFHPTEEELVDYYLKKKIISTKIDLDVIIDIDLYKMEPWDIQARCNLGYEEQNEWYFFSHKDRKYPTGTRTNRATAAGFWKATGRDKAVLSKNRIIGMRKTLVFYKGRAPNGRKTDWIMHEYRLQNSEHAPPQEEGWVVCRAFRKPIPNQRPTSYDPWFNQMYLQINNQTNNFLSPMIDSEIGSASNANSSLVLSNFYQPNNFGSMDRHNMELPQLDSPSLSPSLATKDFDQGFEQEEEESFNGLSWNNLDCLLETQATDFPNALASSSECSYPTSVPWIPQNCELETNSHFLGCYPDS